jgi:hypothetical protein
MTAAHFLLHLVPPRVLLRFLWLLMIDYGSPAPAASLIFNGFRQAANFGQRSRQKKKKNQNSGGCLTLSGHIIITESTGSCSFFVVVVESVCVSTLSIFFPFILLWLTSEPVRIKADVARRPPFSLQWPSPWLYLTRPDLRRNKPALDLQLISIGMISSGRGSRIDFYTEHSGRSPIQWIKQTKQKMRALTTKSQPINMEKFVN